MSTPLPPLRLYLDSGDLMAVADGEAGPHDQILRETIVVTDARVVYSWVHLVDLLDADDDTRRRWADAVDSLGRAEWIVVDEGEAKIEDLRWPTVWSTFDLLRQSWSPIGPLVLAGRKAARDAHAVDKSRPLSPRKLRAAVAQIFDGEVGADVRSQLAQYGLDLDQIAAEAANYGLSRDDVLGLVAVDPREATARGDIVQSARRRLDADRDRKPMSSDLADGLHFEFLPHVDVFTADRYVATHIEGARPYPRPRTQTCAHVVRTRHLDEVVRVLRLLADDTADPAGP